jgi:glutamate 5-kinase
VLLSDIDALYTRPPSEPGARPISHVPFDDDLSGVELGDIGAAGVGTGGAGTKIAAAKHAAAAGTPVLFTSTANVSLALAGAETGTWFDAAPAPAAG